MGRGRRGLTGLPGRWGRLTVAALVASTVLAGAACGGGGSSESGGGEGAGAEPETTVSTTADTASAQSAASQGASPTSAPPGKRPRPLPGPPSTAFFEKPGEWYKRLEPLDRAACAALVRDISAVIEDRSLEAANMATALVFRGAARGCANDLKAGRADLACAQASKALLERDPAMVQLLDWALYTYGPAAGRCQQPPATGASSSSTAP